MEKSQLTRPSAKDEASPGRRPRRSRSEGVDLLLAAAINLLRSHEPSDLTVRAVAERATIHHRFINEWFGGKVGLLRAVHDKSAVEIADRIANASNPGDLRGDLFEQIRRQVVLVTWLIQNGTRFDDIERAFPVISQARRTLAENFDMTDDDALRSAHVIGALIYADVLLRPQMVIQPTLDELIAHHLRNVRR